MLQLKDYGRSCKQQELTQSCPTLSRLLCPWDPPGNNTGVCCHFLLQGNLTHLGMEPAPPALQENSWESPSGGAKQSITSQEVRLGKCHPPGVFRRPTLESKVQTIKRRTDQESPGAAPIPKRPTSTGRAYPVPGPRPPDGGTRSYRPSILSTLRGGPLVVCPNLG